MNVTVPVKVKPRRALNADAVFNIIIYALAGLVLITVLYPLYFVVIASISNPYSVSGGKVWLFPVGITLEGYSVVFNNANIWLGYRNTIIYTIVGTLIGLAVNIPAAYALSRKDLIGRRAISFIFIFTMFFDGGLIPKYFTVQAFGLYDTFWIMVLPFSVAVYNILVARTFFTTNISQDLWDAARIDGCGNLRFFFQIVIPLSKAIIAVIGLWIAVGQWNAYFNALIYIKNHDLYPMQLILRDILIMNKVQSALGTGEAAEVALRRAALLRYSVIIVTTIPIMLFYPFVQKYFDQGVMIGAVKG